MHATTSSRIYSAAYSNWLCYISNELHIPTTKINVKEIIIRISMAQATNNSGKLTYWLCDCTDYDTHTKRERDIGTHSRMVMMQLFSLTRLQFAHIYTYTFIWMLPTKSTIPKRTNKSSRMNGEEVRHFGVLSKRVTQMPFSVDQIQLI